MWLLDLRTDERTLLHTLSCDDEKASWYGDLAYQNPTTALWLLPWCSDLYELEKDKALFWALSSCSRACFQICQLKQSNGSSVHLQSVAYSSVLLSCTFVYWKTCTAYFVTYFVVFTCVPSTGSSSERSARQTKHCGFSFISLFLGIREEEIAKPH